VAQKKVREKTSALRGLMRISMAYKEFTLHMRVFKLIHKGKGKGESSLYHSSGARAVSDKRHIDTPYSC
jgi:hypothetical protein